MIARTADQTLKEYEKGFPVIALVGPRQSGKTTLARTLFGDRPYVSLENLDTREFARSDPRGFLERYAGGAIFDEIQNAVHLLSYLQERVDTSRAMGRFIITGSQQYNLREGISQSLAGRVGAVTLLPFSVEELTAGGAMNGQLDDHLYRGSYPPLYDRPVSPSAWYENYVASYVERDVRQIIAVRDLTQFQTFLRLCAGRTGQLLNLSSLADDAGITHNTARAWISVLEAGFLLYRLPPHFRSFNKRLTKSPKLFVTDPGLAAWLLGIQSAEQLAFHPLRGALFETFVVSEFLKARRHRGLGDALYFWRDRSGLEVDALFDRAGTLHPAEAKAGATVTDDMLRNLRRWHAVAGNAAGVASLIYGGTERYRRSGVRVLPWCDPVPEEMRA